MIINLTLYKERECTFMSDQLACEKFGRKDLIYQFWRWQPHQCNLPRSPFMSLYRFSFVFAFHLYAYTIVFLSIRINHIKTTGMNDDGFKIAFGNVFKFCGMFPCFML